MWEMGKQQEWLALGNSRGPAAPVTYSMMAWYVVCRHKSIFYIPHIALDQLLFSRVSSCIGLPVMHRDYNPLLVCRGSAECQAPQPALVGQARLLSSFPQQVSA